MKTKSTLAIACAALLMGSSFNEAKANQRPVTYTPLEQLQQDDYLHNTIILKVRPEYRALCSSEQIGIPSVNDFFLMLEADQVKKMFPFHKAPEKPFNEYGAPMIDLSLIYTVHYSSAMPLDKAIGKLNNMGYFEYVQPYFIPKTFLTTNDPTATNAGQYHLFKIAAAGNGTTGWNISTGSATTVIGITDTGVELSHGDLNDNIAYNTADPINGMDDDGDQYLDNYQGWDVAMNDNNPTWQGNAHGVHVSGCAAAETNNNTQGAGTGYNCKFLPVKIADASGALTGSYQGIVYAADHGCSVINCSWGGTGGGPFEQSIIDYATNVEDAVVVAAAGNNSADQAFYPACLDKVLSVASTTSSDSKSGFSNYHTTVDICAPGSNINATWTNNSYTLQSGTSMASPVTAGALAIVRSYYPSYNAIQAAERLKQTADVVAANNTYPGKMGTGRVNLYRALTDPASISAQFINVNYTDNNDDVFVIGDTIRISGDFFNYLGPTTNLNASMSVVTAGGFVTVLDGTTNPGAIGSMLSVNNNADPFTVKINANCPMNQAISLKVTLTDGSWTSDQYLNIVVNVDYINIAINDVATSITSKGLIGYNATVSQGLGFTYLNSGSLLYEGSFMVGVSGNVRDMARGTGANPDVDFASLNTVREVVPAAVSDMDVDGRFRDNASANALPVTVHHSAYAWTSAPHTKYVMVKYVIYNTGTAQLNNVYGGIFMDWDIDAATYGSNKADVDNVNRMGYAYYSGANGTYCGVKLLSNTSGFRCYSIDNTNGGNGGVNMFDGYDDSEKYTTLSTNRAQAGASTSAGNDVCQVVSSGPFTINAGDSVVVAFALLAGDDLADLQNSAMDAQNMYDTNLPTGVQVVAGEAGSQLSVYPNPASGQTMIQYNMNETGSADIRLYDAAGREVMSLVQGTQQKGVHFVSFDAGTLPEGVYFIRMTDGEMISTQRLMIAK